MLGKAIFARRARQPATTPSPQPQLEPTVSSPSRFTRKLRKFKQVFKRSSSLEKDASPSVVHPQQDLPVPAYPRQVLQTASRSSQGPNFMTQRGVETFDQRPRGPHPNLPPVLGPSPLSQPQEKTFSTSPRSTATRPTFSGNPPLRHAPLPPVDTTPTTAFPPRSARPARPSPRFEPQEDTSVTSTPSTTSRPTLLPTHPRQVPQTIPHSSQGPNFVTQRGVETFDQRPRGSYPSLPPVLSPSPLLQPREETFATSPRPTAARPTFSGDPPLRHAPLPPVDPTPTAFSPRSPRSPRPARFHPPQEISATSTPSTASRPTFSPNHSITLTPPQSFDGTLSADRSPRTSPLLQPSKEILAASTPSNTPYPMLPLNPSLLTPPQSANTTPTMVSSQPSLTSQPSEQAADDSAAARKIADLRATIAVLQRKRDDYLDSVQHELRNRICPRVRAYEKQRDDQVAALERAKADLAQKIEARDTMGAMWRQQREERLDIDEAAAEVKKEWLEKLKRCRDLTIEESRLLFQQEQWVRRGWRRRDWVVDDSEYNSEGSADQYSVQQSSYLGGSSGNSQSWGTRSTGSVSTDWAPRPGLYMFAANAYRRASTQGSSSIEFEMVGETVQTHHRARGTSQPSLGTLDEFGARTPGSTSRHYTSDEYSDNFA